MGNLREFKLNGDISRVKTGKIKIFIYGKEGSDFQMEKEEVLITESKFWFTGRISHPVKAYLTINDSLLTNEFFLDQGNQYTAINLDSLSQALQVVGSKTNSEYLQNFLKTMKPFDERIEQWYNDYWNMGAKFNQLIPARIEDSMQKVYGNINRSKDSSLLTYTEINQKSFVALWELYRSVYLGGYKLIYENCFDQFDELLQKSGTGRNLAKLIESTKRTQLGYIFPFFKVKDSEGKSLKSQISLLRKVTLIDFWFSKCGPCIAQFEKLKNIYMEYNNKGFQLLGISVDKKRDKEAWKSAIDKFHLPWPQFLDENQIATNVLNINSFPSNFLLDGSGKIIGKDLSPVQIEEFLRKNL